MDPFLQFLTWQFVMFCMGVATITSVIRNMVEFAYEDAKKTKLWTKLILVVMPVVIGGIAGAFLTGPYPEGINDRDSRIIYGIVAGLFSSQLYRILKGILNAKIGASEEAEEELLNSVRGSINPSPSDTITTTITTVSSVPVVDGQAVMMPVAPIAPIAPLAPIAPIAPIVATNSNNTEKQPIPVEIVSVPENKETNE